jgi:hypothetical protein
VVPPDPEVTPEREFLLRESARDALKRGDVDLLIRIETGEIGTFRGEKLTHRERDIVRDELDKAGAEDVAKPAAERPTQPIAQLHQSVDYTATTRAPTDAQAVDP